MKLAYNSAYIQIESVNLPLPSMPLLCISFFVPMSKKLLCQMPNIKLCNTHCREVLSLSHRYATSTLHCHMHPMRYIADIVLSHPDPRQKKKEICTFPTENINPQSSHWNNGKMKIACSSAYVQTET